MTGFNLANIQSNFSQDKIFEDMESLFNQFGRILVLLDETLEKESFKELKSCLNEENIIYLPLALGNRPKDTNLFFIEITSKEILEKVGKEISEKMSKNFEIENTKYLVHGVGVSLLENKLINERFKKSIVVQDINSKILLRWYDPRVLSYLDQIFHEEELNSLLGLFESWKFVHPTGYFSWDKQKETKFNSKIIKKLSYDQSLALDLVEICNLIFLKAYDFEEIDKQRVNPKNILLNLFIAHEEYQIHKYSDLFSYGLYAEILGKNFVKHPKVEKILDEYWSTNENQSDFNEVMDLIDRNSWKIIKQDLYNLEMMNHG